MSVFAGCGHVVAHALGSNALSSDIRQRQGRGMQAPAATGTQRWC
jgi:hypothetical protein